MLQGSCLFLHSPGRICCVYPALSFPLCITWSPFSFFPKITENLPEWARVRCRALYWCYSEINSSFSHSWSCSGLSHLNCWETRWDFCPRVDWIPLYLLFLEPTHVFLHMKITPLWISSFSSQYSWSFLPLSSETHKAFIAMSQRASKLNKKV